MDGPDGAATHTSAAARPMPNHPAAMNVAADFLASKFSASLASEVHTVGHRVVHGLTISNPTLIT